MSAFLAALRPLSPFKFPKRTKTPEQSPVKVGLKRTKSASSFSSFNILSRCTAPTSKNEYDDDDDYGMYNSNSPIKHRRPSTAPSGPDTAVNRKLLQLSSKKGIWLKVEQVHLSPAEVEVFREMRSMSSGPILERDAAAFIWGQHGQQQAKSRPTDTSAPAILHPVTTAQLNRAGAQGLRPLVLQDQRKREAIHWDIDPFSGEVWWVSFKPASTMAACEKPVEKTKTPARGQKRRPSWRTPDNLSAISTIKPVFETLSPQLEEAPDLPPRVESRDEDVVVRPDATLEARCESPEGYDLGQPQPRQKAAPAVARFKHSATRTVGLNDEHDWMSPIQRPHNPLARHRRARMNNDAVDGDDDPFVVKQDTRLTRSTAMIGKRPISKTSTAAPVAIAAVSVTNVQVKTAQLSRQSSRRSYYDYLDGGS